MTPNKSLLLFTLPFFITQSFANDIENSYGESNSIALGYKQSIKKSPSAISVITSDDIKKMGAVTIEEVFETIPGFHVSYANGIYPQYMIRGIGSTLNSTILVYLDGIQINSATESSSFFTLNHLAKNVEKIEIIKGPGSALYGADAFAGVINIITKKNKGTDFGSFVGSFDNYGGWVNHGFNAGDIDISFSAQGGSNKGDNKIVNRDLQTRLDQIFNTNASLAPGSVNQGKEETDIKLEATHENKRLYLRYIRNNQQNGVGVSKSLDNDGYIASDSWVTGLNIKFGGDILKTTFDINYTGYSLKSESNLFPAGAMGGLFQTPVINKLSYKSHTFLTDLSTVYKGIDAHTVHGGIGFKYDHAGNVIDERNYIQTTSGLLVPTGDLQKTSELGIPAITGSQSRYNPYLFIQDEWSFLNNFSLTVGARLDYFSDFGLTINPRTSLVWDFSQSVTTKLMYGKAFRAPSFLELHTNSIPLSGDKNLKPEETQTVEWSIEKSWNYFINTKLNIFWYETDNLITEEVPSGSDGKSRIYTNSKGVNAYGLEAVFDYKVTDTLGFNINYSFLELDPKNEIKDQFIITSPKHQIFASINWEFIPDWSTNLQVNSVIGRKRKSLDIRPQIPDYTVLDLSLRGQNILNYFDLTFKINNLLDEDIRYPSIDKEGIPGDYPGSGISFMGIISVNL